MNDDSPIDALEAGPATEGVVDRDLKPENVAAIDEMVVSDEDLVKLTTDAPGSISEDDCDPERGPITHLEGVIGAQRARIDELVERGDAAEKQVQDYANHAAEATARADRNERLHGHVSAALEEAVAQIQSLQSELAFKTTLNEQQANLLREQEQSIAAFGVSHAEEFVRLKAEHTSELDREFSSHAEEVMALRQELENVRQLSNAAHDMFETSAAAFHADHAEEIAKLKAEHAAAIAAEASKFQALADELRRTSVEP